MGVITVRDKGLLGRLGDYELMSTSQLCGQCFPGIRKTTALRRLRKLEHQNLIKRTPGLENGEAVWSLAPFGAHTIHRDSFLEKINRNNLEHDVLLGDIRIKFEKSGIASSWVTEQSLRRSAPKQEYHSWGQIIPDAVFATQTQDGFQAVALELELSAKNPARYEKIFSLYRRRKQFWGLWYLVGDPSIGRKISRAWTKVNPKVERPKLGWALVDDVMSGVGEFKLKTLTGSLLIKFGNREGAHTPAQRVSSQ
jgi:hypothetical protein